MAIMSVKEFHEIGLLQEVNRLFLHPIGLALSVVVNENGEIKFGDIIDYRDDPEGIVFNDLTDEESFEKANNVRNLNNKFNYRLKKFGWNIQPIGNEIREEHPDIKLFDEDICDDQLG